MTMRGTSQRGTDDQPSASDSDSKSLCPTGPLSGGTPEPGLKSPPEGQETTINNRDVPATASSSSSKSKQGGTLLDQLHLQIERALEAWRQRVEYLVKLVVLSLWVGGFIYAGVSFLVSLAFLPHPFATFWAALCIAMITVPMTKPPRWARRYLQFSIDTACKWNRTKVVLEDPDSFQDPAAGPFIFGIEPHGVMPVAMAELFNQYSGAMPPSVQKNGIYTLASSAVFYAPFVRHMWWWLGIRPVGRDSVKRLLSKRASVALNPGGVVECLRMEHGREIVYLKNRRGFVRLAQEVGAKIVPVYVFGHTTVYSYRRYDHPLLERFSRFCGFAPMLFWGFSFTPIPHPTPLTVIIGRPIDVPQNAEGREDSGVSCTSEVPSRAASVGNGGGAATGADTPPAAPEPNVVDHALLEFISEMRRIYNKHRGEYGDPERDLVVL